MTRKQAITKLHAGATDFPTWYAAQFPAPERIDEQDVKDAESRAATLRQKFTEYQRWNYQMRDVAYKAWLAAKQEETTNDL